MKLFLVNIGNAVIIALVLIIEYITWFKLWSHALKKQSCRFGNVIIINMIKQDNMVFNLPLDKFPCK